MVKKPGGLFRGWVWIGPHEGYRGKPVHLRDGHSQGLVGDRRRRQVEGDGVQVLSIFPADILGADPDTVGVAVFKTLVPKILPGKFIIVPVAVLNG